MVKAKDSKQEAVEQLPQIDLDQSSALPEVRFACQKEMSVYFPERYLLSDISLVQLRDPTGIGEAPFRPC
jgi:hypothetical protein